MPMGEHAAREGEFSPQEPIAVARFYDNTKNRPLGLCRLEGLCLTPESLAMCLRIHPRGGAVSDERFRRRDADGCGRDDRAPRKVVADWGVSQPGGKKN